MSDEDKNGGDDAFYKGLSYAARIGIELVAATVIGAGLGYFGDRYFKTSPWLMIIGVLLGSAAGFLNVFRFVQSGQADQNNHKD
jgi:ATP synthase protein I